MLDSAGSASSHALSTTVLEDLTRSHEGVISAGRSGRFAKVCQFGQDCVASGSGDFGAKDLGFLSTPVFLRVVTLQNSSNIDGSQIAGMDGLFEENEHTDKLSSFAQIEPVFKLCA